MVKGRHEKLHSKVRYSLYHMFELRLYYFKGHCQICLYTMHFFKAVPSTVYKDSVTQITKNDCDSETCGKECVTHTELFVALYTYLCLCERNSVEWRECRRNSG